MAESENYKKGTEIRRKLEPDPDHPQVLTTEPGVGYRLLTEA